MPRKILSVYDSWDPNDPNSAQTLKCATLDHLGNMRETFCTTAMAFGCMVTKQSFHKVIWNHKHYATFCIMILR